MNTTFKESKHFFDFDIIRIYKDGTEVGYIRFLSGQYHIQTWNDEDYNPCRCKYIQRIDSFGRTVHTSPVFDGFDTLDEAKAIAVEYIELNPYFHDDEDDDE